jgi:hypothetical protein
VQLYRYSLIQSTGQFGRSVKEIDMKRLLNFAAIFTLLFALGSAADAQTKKKPVLKKPVAKKPVPKPVIPVYTVDTGTVIRVRMNSTISSKTSTVGSTFTTTVTEPVYSSTGVVVIPVGSIVNGRVDAVTKAAKKGQPGSISASFVSVKLPNGRVRTINGQLTELDSKTAKSDNEGGASGDKMKHRKVIWYGGGAAGGALLGAAIGGGKGALIGGILGAGGGFLGERYTKGEEATVKSGSEFGIYLNQKISLPKFVEVVP